MELYMLSTVIIGFGFYLYQMIIANNDERKKLFPYFLFIPTSIIIVPVAFLFIAISFLCELLDELGKILFKD